MRNRFVLFVSAVVACRVRRHRRHRVGFTVIELA